MVCDLLHKIELLNAAGTHIIPADAHAVAASFYDMLTILDDKGLALLAFDGIIVAATTFAAEKGGAFQRRGMARALAVLIIILALAASVACLLVSEISYPFYGHVVCTAAQGLNFTDEISHLAASAYWRTFYFHIAWWLSLVAIPLFLILFWVSLHVAKSSGHRES